MWEAGMDEVDQYALRSKNMVTQYIATRPIMDLYEEALWRPGTQISKIWWEQEGLYLQGAWLVSEAEAEGGPEEVQVKVEGLEGN